MIHCDEKLLKLCGVKLKAFKYDTIQYNTIPNDPLR